MDHTATTATRIIVDAMVRRDVRRLVVATTTGDSLDETMTSSIKRVRLPVFAPRIGDPSLVGRDGSEERIIKESPLDWTIVRVPIVNDPERGTELSREDVATFLVEQLNDSTNIHESRCEKFSIPVGYRRGPTLRRGATLRRHCSKRNSRRANLTTIRWVSTKSRGFRWFR